MNENVQQTVALDLNYQILIIAIDFAFIFRIQIEKWLNHFFNLKPSSALFIQYRKEICFQNCF